MSADDRSTGEFRLGRGELAVQLDGPMLVGLGLLAKESLAIGIVGRRV